MRYCLLFLLTLLFAFTAQGQITGASNVCVGATTTLSCTTPPGGTWSSSDTAVARINAAGEVTGMSFGTAVITYRLLPTIHTFGITVNPIPAAITGGSFTVCTGSALTLASATPGGIWSNSETSVATVNTATGVVSGLAPGTSTVYYTLGSMCSRNVTVTVNSSPSYITGPSSLCAGTSAIFTDTTSGGTWASSNTTVAAINASTGSVNPLAAGTANISYVLPTGCARVTTLTVNALPTPISGPATVCAGSFVTLSSSPSGGAWSSGNPAIVTVHAVTGVATGISAGAAGITYTLGTGCRVTRVMTANPLPAAITGTPVTCPGATTILSNSVPGGAWVSGSTPVATVTTSGSSATVSGISSGTSVISYSTGTSCAAYVIVTVNTSPYAGTISGPSTVCTGTTITLSSTVSGGSWSTSTPATATVGTGGVVSGVAPGTAFITYAVTNSCGTATTFSPVTVSVPPTVITGPTHICGGTTTTLVNGTPGGLWSTSSAAIATVGMGTGVVTGIAAGTVVVTYAIAPGCEATAVVTVNAAPSAITGPDSVCVGSSATLANTVTGGTWSSSSPAVASIGVLGVTTGVVIGLAPGSAIITYAIGSCYALKIVDVNALPVVSASAVPAACGGAYALNASGASSYSWAPSAGISCATCPSATIFPTATATLTVTGTNAAGCAATATVAVNGNRIYGHILFNYGMPATTDTRVWLVQYNPSDSSIVATDSLVSCMDGGLPYFEFSIKPAGNYLLKARLLSSVAGTSDYVPTYADSSLSWLTAATVSHTSASDMQDITMKFGTVPSGPGFISGNVFSGAGKGTSGEIPHAGMLVYLKDAATGNVLTYAYTNAAGYYSFGSIGEGSYVISPDEMDYYTTPSPVITISATAYTVGGVSFKRSTTLHTIYPYAATAVGSAGAVNNGISIFPNPAGAQVTVNGNLLQVGTSVSITDVTGRALVSTTIPAGGTSASFDVSSLSDGLYLLSINAGGHITSQKLFVSHK